MKIHNHPQGSPSWWKARRGKPTGSNLGRIGFGAHRDNIFDKRHVKIAQDNTPDPWAVKCTARDGFFIEATKAKLKGFDITTTPPDWEILAHMANSTRYTTAETRALGKVIPRDLTDGAKTYAAELIAEGIGWQRDEFAGSPDIERGHELEDKARQFLAFEIGEEISEVGFCVSDCGRYGASPDGVIYASGKPRAAAAPEAGGNAPAGAPIPVELKCPDFHTQARYLIDGGGVPAKYPPQVHGHMIVTGAPYAYFCAYTASPLLKRILVKVERDAYTEQLQRDVEEFCARLEEMRETCLENNERCDALANQKPNEDNE